MDFSETTSLLVIFFLCAEVQSNNGWGVTYSPSQGGICALKGSTVEMKCEYRYPSNSGRTYTNVIEKFWLTGNDPVSLETKEEYEGRVTNSCDETRGKKSCTLRMTDLKESDSAVYKFRFITNPSGGGYTGEPGIQLSVTDPHLTVSVQREDSSSYKILKCSSSCHLPSHPTYVWYKNGQKIDHYKSTYLINSNYLDSISCAIKGHEDFPAPLICVRGSDCNKVIYSDGRICAAKGSSVSIRSSYYSLYSVSSKFWFHSGRSERRDHSEPENIELDPQYTGRLTVTDTEGEPTLIISNLRESDSGEYRFIFRTNYWYIRWGSDFHGTTLTVTALQVQVVRISANQDSVNAELRCRSSCSPAGSHYIWFKNGQKIIQTGSYYKGSFNAEDRISCALPDNEAHRAPDVYAPVSPSLSVDPSADIFEGSSVTLRCSSEANPPANYTWYKKTKTSTLQPLSQGSEFLLNNIQSSDSGEYYCEAENQLGKRRSTNLNVDVKYPPRLPSVSVNPPGEIVVGGSVTLTCSSDANPEPSYSWYKDNLMIPVGHEGVFHVPAVKSEDCGTYYCRAENKHGRISSSSVDINVEYPPRFPSVSVNPPGEIVVGGSVNLTCSSDANPAATYAWYKENITSPAADGPILTIVDIRHEDGGNYYCEARNSRGQHNSNLQLIVVSSSATSAIAGSITFLVLVGLFVVTFFIFRKKMASRPASEIRESSGENRKKSSGQNFSRQLETPSTAALGNSTDQDDLCYAAVSFSKKQEEPVYSNFIPAEPKTPQHKEEEEDVEYSEVMVKKTPGPRNHDAS